MDAQKIFELHLPNKSSLYSHYMPFLEGGGLFIPTAETYCPGDKVFLTLGFLAEPDRYPVAAIVVWLTPVIIPFLTNFKSRSHAVASI